MRIAIGGDPNATAMIGVLHDHLLALGHEVTDFGATDAIYAHTAVAVAEAVAAGTYERGVLVCGTGIGVAIAANKVKGAYAANLGDIYQAQRAALSNNANIVTFGAQVMGLEVAKVLLTEYLAHTFDPNSRSAPKVEAICAYERAQP